MYQHYIWITEDRAEDTLTHGLTSCPTRWITAVQHWKTPKPLQYNTLWTICRVPFTLKESGLLWRTNLRGFLGNLVRSPCQLSLFIRQLSGDQSRLVAALCFFSSVCFLFILSPCTIWFYQAGDKIFLSFRWLEECLKILEIPSCVFQRSPGIYFFRKTDA